MGEILGEGERICGTSSPQYVSEGFPSLASYKEEVDDRGTVMDVYTELQGLGGLEDLPFLSKSP